MTDRYCIVIPHYRHHIPLAALLSRLAPCKLPVVVVDDASGTESVRALCALAMQFPSCTIVKRANNGGKGAAMVTGLTTAWRRGFSHVISLDADGQHDPDDVARLHELSRADPQSLFSGRPLFDADIPAARLHGRKITNTLVKLEAGSRMLEDAMCGLRVYPLQHVMPLCLRIGYRTRMEFDVEILVRACWAGHVVRYLDTKVVYPQGGHSHFDLVADNVRLAAMHTLLIFGALVRLPQRIHRRITHRAPAGVGSARH